LLGVRYKCVDADFFLELNIEEENSFNRRWRKSHLDLVTNYGKYWKLREIYNYFSSNDTISKMQRSVVDTNFSKNLDISNPSLSRFFWSSVNSYFFYCIKYGLVKNVVPYAEIRAFHQKSETLSLYSDEYYASLKK